MMVCATVMFAGCNKDENNEPTAAANGGTNGGGQTTVEWVDLGLPSGLLWAKCNLGATTPEGYGDYYAWGETTTKDVYNVSTYKYCNGSIYALTKYCNTDGLTTLEAMDDAATQKLGSGARIPTKAEWVELINNTTAEWTTMNGVNGRKFTAFNGNSLFLPAAGYRGAEIDDAGSYGTYWSSERNWDDSWSTGNAYYFIFNEGDQGVIYDGGWRYYGQSVRPVRSVR